MPNLRRPRANRGNALILSVMILLALTAVGLLSVQRTGTELMVSANVSRAMQASLAGEAGMFHSLGLVGNAPHSYVLGIARGRDSFGLESLGMAGSNFGVINAGVGTIAACTDFGSSARLGKDVVCYSTALPMMDPEHYLPVVQPSPPQTVARLVQDMAYDGEAIWIAEFKGAPGNEIGSDICYQVFDVSARGGIPTQLEPVINNGAGGTLCGRNDPNCVAETVVVENRSRIVAGPVQCLSK